MKQLFVAIILLLVLIGFALQPTKGKAVPVNLAALRAMPLTLGTFHAVTNNDAELDSVRSTTDGGEGLDRTYIDGGGRKIEMVVEPQTIGQHVPLLCDRYSGNTIVSETQLALPSIPSVRFNELTLKDDSGKEVSTCLYYWKTDEGVFVPRPNHSLGMIAARWSDHQQGLLVNICASDEQAGAPGTTPAMEELLKQSYQQVERLYPAVFHIH